MKIDNISVLTDRGTLRLFFVFACFRNILTYLVSVIWLCVCSIQLERERQQREDAEKEKRELEDRLRKYEDEFEKAKLGQFFHCHCQGVL